jgi:hypothetical protein
MRTSEEAQWVTIIFVRFAGDDIPQIRRENRVGEFSCKHLAARLT